MAEGPTIRKELKEKFLAELTPAEKAFFLRTAREAIQARRFRPSEDLFHYCYFLTVRERLSSVRPERGEGYLRAILVESRKEVEEAVMHYEERLEAARLPEPSAEGERFLERLSS
ncbi:MAG: hypothetical protein Kow0025_22750 [Thermodesulfovibrionales bacterium]